MGAVWLVFGVKLRRYWRSWLLLALLIAIVSGFALAATAAARRTDAAFPSYVAHYGDDAIVYTDKPLPQLAQQPGVTRVVPVQMPYYGQPRCSCGHQIDISDLAAGAVLAVAVAIALSPLTPIAWPVRPSRTPGSRSTRGSSSPPWPERPSSPPS